ncbi:MAG: hypothetical protein NVS2B12_14400 [Ktedonobacteraceae bacterium]
MQKSEARFRAIFNEAAMGIALVDADGHLLESNTALLEMLGYTRAELRNQIFTVITHPDDVALDTGLYSELVQGKRNQYQIEKRYLRKDGSVVEGRLTVSFVRAMGSGEKGGEAFAIGMVEDITERKRAERQLRETMAELEVQYRQAEHARSETRAILDAASEAMILLSPDRRFLTVNHQFSQLFGLSAEEVLGRRFDELQTEFERTFADPAKFRARIAGTATDAEQHFTEIVAQIYPLPRELELFSTPVQGLDERHLGRLYVFRDVTREREVDRMKSEFVSLVSHELRTPLTSIKGYVDLLMDGDAGELDEEQLEYLSIVKNNADRLVALINDLLDVSCIESGKIELQRAILDLTVLVESVASSLHPQIEKKGQNLILNLSATLPSVAGDANRVTQILTNLLSNAHKYTPPGGTITIGVQATEQGQVRVDVQDTGIGLSTEEQAQLFTRFYRAKNPTTQEVGGTGLGLTITRSLVEMHGGQISVVSAPGQGSTFSFTLPVARGTGQLPPIQSLSKPGGRILVVDDEPDIANLIRRYLEHANYEVLVAHDAGHALSLARTAHPDLITLDIMLPDTDGFTVLEWLKNDLATAAIPVVMLSMMDDTSRGKLLGAVDYLRKPIEERVLLERVGSILVGDRTHTILVAEDDIDVRNLIAGNLRRAGYAVVEAVNGAEAVVLAQDYHPDLALIDIKMPTMDGITALRELRAEKAGSRQLPAGRSRRRASCNHRCQNLEPTPPALDN